LAYIDPLWFSTKKKSFSFILLNQLLGLLFDFCVGPENVIEPNTFEPAPNIISKIPKIPFIPEMKIRN